MTSTQQLISKYVYLQQYLKQYIEIVTDKNMKQFLYSIFNYDYVIQQLILQSSSSGKYHPSDEISGCGLFIHSLKVCNYAISFYRTFYNCTRENLDIIITSSLIHDLPYKFFINNDNSYRLNNKHAVDNSMWFEKEIALHNINEEKINKIRNCILFHLGRWEQTNSTYFDDKQQNELTYIIHWSDYMSSRKNMSIDYTNIDYILNDLKDFK